MTTHVGSTQLDSKEDSTYYVYTADWSLLNTLFIKFSSRGGATQLHSDGGELDECEATLGSTGEETPQRRDRPLRGRLPPEVWSGGRLAYEHDGDESDHRGTGDDDGLYLPDTSVHREGTGTLEQSTTLQNIWTPWVGENTIDTRALCSNVISYLWVFVIIPIIACYLILIIPINTCAIRN